jgi:hypothetical protein
MMQSAKMKGLCLLETFKEGLMPTAKIIEDIIIDKPKAQALFVTMVNGAWLDEWY